MQARVEISSALLNDLALLTGDAPAFGLDPSERVRVRHLLSELAGERVMRLATRVGYRAQAVSGLFFYSAIEVPPQSRQTPAPVCYRCSPCATQFYLPSHLPALYS